MNAQSGVTHLRTVDGKNPADHVRYIKSDCNNGRFFIFVRRDFFRQFGLKSATKIKSEYQSHHTGDWKANEKSQYT